MHGKLGLITCHNCGETEEVFAQSCMYLIIVSIFPGMTKICTILRVKYYATIFCKPLRVQRLEMLLNYLFYSRSSTVFRTQFPQDIRFYVSHFIGQKAQPPSLPQSYNNNKQSFFTQISLLSHNNTAYVCLIN